MLVCFSVQVSFHTDVVFFGWQNLETQSLNLFDAFFDCSMFDVVIVCFAVSILATMLNSTDNMDILDLVHFSHKAPGCFCHRITGSSESASAAHTNYFRLVMRGASVELCC